MKVPYKWLSDFIDTKGLKVADVSSALTLSGSEVDALESPKEFANIVVGEIKEIMSHENADKLRVTKTYVGKSNGGTLQIVCGAPNIEVGQKVPVALVGASFGEFTIKEAEIRGVKSFGMLCSERELEISDSHEGIMLLSEKAKVGEKLSDYKGGDYVLDLDITPNRGDCLSVVGVAREAAAALGQKSKNLTFQTAKISSQKTIEVEVKEKELCPRYIAKVVEGIKIGPSPKWMQERLVQVGVRPINNVVDVTNYVMAELGQPLHAFDGKKMEGKIIVRKAKKDETVITLDGQKRILTADDLLICDSKKPVALAGVMGGLNSEVDEKTTTVVLEAAVFDATTIRKTAQRLNLRSEASNRFEKGIPLTLPDIAIERAATLLTEIPGGLAGEMPVVKPKAGERTDVLSKWMWIQHIGLRLSRLNKFIGIEIPESKSTTILSSLGFEVEKYDFKKEARKLVGKPYIFGASFKTHGDLAFDCSYLTDYLYSKIGKFVGYTSLAQYEIGTPVSDEDLKPGDILFVKGVIDKSVTDHYFTPDGSGGYEKITLKKPKEVGHNAIYIGNDRVVHARHFEYDVKTKSWKKATKAEVVEESAKVFTSNPGYLGARRYVEDSGDFLAVTVPWWRLDIKVEEDVFEEIGRIYGYDNLPSTLPSGELPLFPENKKRKLISSLKAIFSGAGFFEVYNYSFVSEKMIEAVGINVKDAVTIANPISPDQKYMRVSLIPSLLNNGVTNQENYDSFKIFEIAPIFQPQKDELPKEVPTLSILVKSNQKSNAAALFELKGALELVLQKLNMAKIELKAEKWSFLTDGQSAAIVIGGKKVGIIGMVAEKVRHEFKLKTPVAIAEINLPTLLELTGRVVKYGQISKYPMVTRDINLLFPIEQSAEGIIGKIKKTGINNLMSSELIDVYESSDLPEGQKSVTIRLLFGSAEKTLSEEEIKENLNSVQKILTGGIGGRRRD